MPLNPGDRWPNPTKTQQVATLVRTNAVIVAFAVGTLFGTIVTLIGGLR